MPKFSIVIPTHNRADGRLQRAISSIALQTYQDFECIVVDDGSTDRTYQLLCAEFDGIPATYGCKHWNFHYIKHDERQGRIIARNTGMAAATGEWICHLDSDDAYDLMYLATFAHNIEQEPDADVWVCGAVFHGMVKPEKDVHICPAWSKLVPPFVPPLATEGGDIHAHFDSGKVTMGQFVYRRECYEKIGPYPEWVTPMDVADGCNEWLGYDTGYSSRSKAEGGRWVGNPYGEDWVLFRKLSQHYVIHKIDAALYVHYLR